MHHITAIEVMRATVAFLVRKVISVGHFIYFLWRNTTHSINYAPYYTTCSYAVARTSFHSKKARSMGHFIYLLWRNTTHSINYIPYCVANMLIGSEKLL